MEILLFLLMFAGLIVMAAISALFRGWVLSILWGWFMVPLGLPALSVVTCMGVALVIGFLTHQYVDNDNGKDGGERIARLISFAILYPLIALLMGWIIKQFA